MKSKNQIEAPTEDLFSDIRPTVLEVKTGKEFLELCQRSKAGEFRILSVNGLGRVRWQFIVRYPEFGQ